MCLVGAQEPEEDWPTIISRLQYQLNQNPGHAMTRQRLATAYNNYGVSLSEQHQWDLAVQQLEEAIRLDGANERFQANLSSTYLNQADELDKRFQANAALEAVKKAMGYDPKLKQAYDIVERMKRVDPVLREVRALGLGPSQARLLAQACSVLGRVQYDRQKLAEAEVAWRVALECDPTIPNLQGRLDQLAEERPVESQFERLSQGYFDIRYEETLEQPAGFDIRDALLDARSAVGSDFSYWPRPPRKIIVLLYSAESFRRIRQETPDWIAGQFDGKIRVPFPSTTLPEARVREILFHEYTHAVIYDLTKGTCPLWLNEGLAEYQGRSQNAGTLTHLQAAHQANGLIPWQELSEHFSTALGAEHVALAYEQSYSLVAYLVRRYGFWKIRRLLRAIAEGQPWEAALEQEVRLKPTRLEAEWRRWLPEFLASPMR
jgi:tetratricopeptide (TPR) repeat protein